MSDAELERRIKETKYVVEASSDECFMLWEKFSNEAMFKRPDFNVHKWEQLNPGLSLTLGEIVGRPVCMHIWWYKIDGVMVMFWEMTSQLQDYAMAEKWLEEHCDPKEPDGRSASCNCANFAHCLHFIADLNNKKD